MNASDASETPQRFDQQHEQLVQLVPADLPLDESLAAVEQGVSLARRGQQILDAAQRNVELPLRDGSTELLNETEPLNETTPPDKMAASGEA